jgi:hypothetical protein
MKKIEDLEKTIKQAIIQINQLKDENLKQQKNSIDFKLELREKEKEIAKLKKDFVEYQYIKDKYEEAKKRLENLVEKIEKFK